VRRTIPVAFQNLQKLVLYPGNVYICSLPALSSGTVRFTPVQSGGVPRPSGLCFHLRLA
jgi:hypothetical protein